MSLCFLIFLVLQAKQWKTLPASRTRFGHRFLIVFDSILAGCFITILVAAWNHQPIATSFKVATYVLVLFELLFRGQLNRYLSRVDESDTKLFRHLHQTFKHRIHTLRSAFKPALRYAAGHIKDPVVIEDIDMPFQFSTRRVASSQKKFFVVTFFVIAILSIVIVSGKAYNVLGDKDSALSALLRFLVATYTNSFAYSWIAGVIVSFGIFAVVVGKCFSDHDVTFDTKRLMRFIAEWASVGVAIGFLVACLSPAFLILQIPGVSQEIHVLVSPNAVIEFTAAGALFGAIIAVLSCPLYAFRGEAPLYVWLSLPVICFVMMVFLSYGFGINPHTFIHEIVKAGRTEDFMSVFAHADSMTDKQTLDLFNKDWRYVAGFWNQLAAEEGIDPAGGSSLYLGVTFLVYVVQFVALYLRAIMHIYRHDPHKNLGISAAHGTEMSVGVEAGHPHGDSGREAH
ncbi:low affinity Fe/Cu permease [Arcanobacterium pluranimalium]|uniref:hypothetical protein n=1 Tax=Arcanobacterium pluranimalium TaxID=108028 RepID=UPI0019571B59|nr:hypothetical protein [Arcanobacterium pluranimalium]MBM7824771.1 low affinity Fe/Cu permease [Arcanobacterium pluranimalium]